MTLIIGHSCGEREIYTKAIHSWGKPNRSLQSFPIPTWMYSIFGCFCVGDVREMARGIVDSCPPWLDGHIRLWVSREQAFWGKPFIPQMLWQTQKTSVLCVWGGARGSFFQRKSHQQSASRRQTMPASDQSAQRRDIHIQVYELQSVLCHRQKRSGEKNTQARQGEQEVIERWILRMCKHFCNFSLTAPRGNFLLGLFYIKSRLKRFLLRRNKNEGCC